MYPSSTQTPGASMGAATPPSDGAKPVEVTPSAGSAPSVPSSSTTGVEGY